MDILFVKCILYNSKFSLTSKCLGTNGVVVKRVHCMYNTYNQCLEDVRTGNR